MFTDLAKARTPIAAGIMNNIKTANDAPQARLKENNCKNIINSRFS